MHSYGRTWLFINTTFNALGARDVYNTDIIMYMVHVHWHMYMYIVHWHMYMYIVQFTCLHGHSIV